MTINDDGTEIISGDGEGEVLPDLLHDAPYETPGRVDPIYEPAVQQYHAPVAETRSFGSRFWWLIPLLILFIGLPLLLTRCNSHRVEYESYLSLVVSSAILIKS